MRQPTQRVLLGLCVSCVLFACSSVDERRAASGSKAYLDTPAPKPLLIPDGLDKPSTNTDYQIPTISSEATGLYGDDLPVVAPALVLATAQGTYLEEADTFTSAIFDKLDSKDNIRDLVIERISSHLFNQNIAFTIPNQAGNTILTDWILSNETGDKAWYDFGETKQQVGKRFQLNIEPASHGRTARLNVILTDLVVGDEQDLIDGLDPFLKRELEAELLNGIIRQYSLEQKIESQQRLAQIRSGITAELGFDADGNGAIILSSEYDIVWPKFQLVLRKLGFNVKDLDKSNGLVFVSYQSSESTWFSGWFNSSDTLPLTEDDYRITVNALSSNKTSITFKNEDNQPFSAAKTSEIFPIIAENFALDNLDI